MRYRKGDSADENAAVKQKKMLKVLQTALHGTEPETSTLSLKGYMH